MSVKVAERLTIGDWSIIKFVALNILTLNILLYVWIWQMANKLGTTSEQATNRLLAIVIFIAVAWGSILEETTNDAVQNLDPIQVTSMFALVGTLVVLVQYIVSIVLSFRMKPLLEEYCRTHGQNLNLGSIWCFLLPFYYQYYKLCKLYSYLEQNHDSGGLSEITLKLRKLEILKEQGRITDEQYRHFKERLLSNL